MADIEKHLEDARAALSQLRVTEAARLYQKVLELEPNNLDALVGLGRIQLMLENEEQGLHWLDKALDIAPDHAEALALKGVHALRRGDYAAAIGFLEDARAADASLEMIYFNLAKAYRKAEMYKQAEVTIRQYLKRRPRDYKAHYELAVILHRTGDLRGAILETLESIKINPLYLKGYLTLGRVYELGGQGNLVIKLYHEGLRHNPNALPLREELIRLYQLKADWRSALEQAHEVVQRRGDYSDYLTLGKCQLAMGQFEEAEQTYKHAVELDDSLWQAHYNLGELYMTARLMPEAETEYRAALERGRNVWIPYNGMGLWLLHQDRAEEARAYFVKALELSPAAPEPTLNLALACARLGDTENAMKFAKATSRICHEGDGMYEQAVRLQQVLQSMESQEAGGDSQA
jgi:tetratricopeptide (TPR) repeat protein